VGGVGSGDRPGNEPRSGFPAAAAAADNNAGVPAAGAKCGGAVVVVAVTVAVECAPIKREAVFTFKFVLMFPRPGTEEVAVEVGVEEVISVDTGWLAAASLAR
jgi:hypothetical protein